MKQRIVLVMFVAVVAVAVAVAGFFSKPLQAQERKGPRLELKETTYDFGKVVEGARLQHVFQVGNTGDAALDIQRIQPT